MAPEAKQASPQRTGPVAVRPNWNMRRATPTSRSRAKKEAVTTRSARSSKKDTRFMVTVTWGPWQGLQVCTDRTAGSQGDVERERSVRPGS